MFFKIYALRLESEIDLPGLEATEGPAQLSLVVEHLPRVNPDEFFFFGGQLPGEKTDWLTVSRTTAGDRLSFYGVGDFLIQPERIVFSPSGGTVTGAAPTVFYSTVMAYWFENRGAIALHASAIEAQGLGTTGFVAFNGHGKSSLAAEFTAHGSQLVTDDVLILEPSADETLALPALPQLRFRRATASHFLGDQAFDRLTGANRGSVKCEISLGHGFGAFSEGPGPLRALWLLERGEKSEIEIVQVSPLEAVIEMTRHSFLGYLPSAAGWQGQRLGRLCTLAARVPMLRLRYPSGFEHLAAVRTAIFERLSNLYLPAI